MKTLEQFRAELGKRKTGYYGQGIDTYTKRDGSNERVLRVTWFVQNADFATYEDFEKAVKRLRKSNNPNAKMPRFWHKEERLFPFTDEGLAAAIRMSDATAGFREKVEEWAAQIR